MASLLGLRIDVDTHDGMRDGVPRLLDLLREAGARASFYLAMGPDRSGMAVLNLLKPGFLRKMGRTRAASVYGLRTVLSGTLLPARPVATAFPETSRRLLREGHEVGTHGWDHRAWQDRLLGFPSSRVISELDRAREAFRGLFGESPATSAAPAWLTDDRALLHQETFGLRFASDCRGSEPFLPLVEGRALATPQVPSTLPTLDEALGDTCGTAEGYFVSVAEAAGEQAWPVLTVHAELEGGPYAGAFAAFLRGLGERGMCPVPLGELLRARVEAGGLGSFPLVHEPVPGRHGVVAAQGGESIPCGA